MTTSTCISWAGAPWGGRRDRSTGAVSLQLPEGGYGRMTEVRRGNDEPLDSALRRFKRVCARAGVLREARKREFYEKPSVKRKKKAEAARRRKRRNTRPGW